jgi:CubicO group peptidase (beta-lactamase class C family)
VKLLAIAIAALVACGPGEPPAAGPRPVAGEPVPATRKPPALVTALDAELAAKLDGAIDAWASKDGVGAVVMIARDGKLVYQHAAGFADREAKVAMRTDTQFRLASMTKPIVSAAALALVDQRVLSLDDPVTRWLPQFRPKLADGREPVITVRHLITHTSGLGYSFLEENDGPLHKAGVSDGLAEPGRAMDENLARLASVPLLYEPGTKWRYSLATDVLGAVIAKAGGAALPEVVRRLITQPLGMTDTAFAVTDRERLAWPYAADKDKRIVRMTDTYDRTGGSGRTVRFSPARIFDTRSFPSGGAGLAGTARDYLVFCEALRSGGANILRPDTVRAMTENQVGTLTGDPGEGFGYGVGVVVDPVAAKSARGKGTYTWAGIYGTSFWIDPEARLSVVILTNVAAGPSPEDAVEKALYGH